MKFKIVNMLFIIAFFCSCHQKVSYATFDDYPVYEGDDLELIYTPESSQFRIWAPTASEVKLLLYDNDSEGSAYQIVSMKSSTNGTWIKKISENMNGKFYTFQVKIADKWLDETPGMWVKATGINGKRAAIIDMSTTNPEGWDNDKRPAQANFSDITLYEVHVRDFSMSPTSGMKNKGKFLAFTETGTKNTADESTGIDHLKALGISHIHLLPAFDFASVDETKPSENKYNWGYDPQNYNVPEGSYSTNPHDPTCRIREFKMMVQALHRSDIRLVMDVVYNHTSAGEKSNLNLLVPGYFYRQNADSTWSNASGCGNETASERAMMRKFIVESVVYWATEYHVDGFRFDLMGIHDIVTMNAVREALDKVDPSIVLYGEGWTAAASPLSEEKRAIKKNASQLKWIAVFSDDLRDALKGSWMHAEIPGFVSGTDSLEESVKFGIVGGIQHDSIDYTKPIYSKAPYVKFPTQTINYVSCHDDLCLVDKLTESKPAGTTDEELIRFNKLAQTIVFTSQGIPFIYAGEELYRTKKGIHNTYQSPDSINQINWNLKTTHGDVFAYYQGLIALRKAHPAFRITNPELIQKHLRFINTKVPNLIAYTLSDHVNGEKWKDILVLLNGNRKAVSMTLPEGAWNVICHDGKIDVNGITPIKSSQFSVAASSASILYIN
ncbi:MAG: type I pullulanase [Porphyromonadaceae bacterium CG2_30_38_12]|nr:MAG: type I pullulanase [Porphyromonadaceae bacterium CG2_30_38_12]